MPGPHPIHGDGHYSFNSMRSRMQAGRERRKNTGSSTTSFTFPFFDRRSTVPAAGTENGQAGHDEAPLRLSQTAPERGPDNNHNTTDPGSSSQQTGTTMVDSSSANGEPGAGLRKRKTNEKEPAKRDDPESGDTKAKGPKTMSIRDQLKFIFGSWVNILLVALPAGFAVNYAGVDGRIVFAVNFIAIIPLAGLLSLATEEIALHLNETIGGLINATFGNAVELIVAVIALIHNEVEVVKTSLVGSILSNLLLVLGMCFFFGGWSKKVQYFNKTVAQTSASLLALAVASNIVPTVFAYHARADTTQPLNIDNANIASLSRGTSVILLVVYAAYLYFQLGTHSKVFAEKSPKAEERDTHSSHKEDAIGQLIKTSNIIGAPGANPKDENNKQIWGTDRPSSREQQDDDEEEEEAQISMLVSLAVLAGSTVFIGFCAEFMVDGISVITASGVSVEFVGLILLPIVGNAAEHVTAVTVAMKDKMDLAIGVACGSSMQVSLFLIPFLVIIGWGMGVEDMNLAFDDFQTAVLFVSVLLVNYLIGDGESHWLEGFLLICLYLIIAVCSWWYPTTTGV